MKLLFDTHAFIWWDADQSKLSEIELAECRSANNTLHLSLVSVWEMQIKTQLGQLSMRLSLAEVLRNQILQNGIIIEPITLDDILGLSNLPNYHRESL